MATKVELLQDWQAYVALERTAHEHLANGDFQKAIIAGVAGLFHLPNAFRCEKRGDASNAKLMAAIDTISRFAPLVLDHQSIKELGDFFKANRSIVKSLNVDADAIISVAEQKTHTNHLTLQDIYLHPGTTIAELHDRIGSLADAAIRKWVKIGLLEDFPSNQLRLCSDLSIQVDAKCIFCGSVSRMERRMAWTSARCGACGKTAEKVALLQ